MNWEIATAIAEMAGAVAVVATLIYLAGEVRQNRKAIESASIDALSAGWNDLNTVIMSDPELAQIMVKGFTDPESLDEIQIYRFQLAGQSYINHFMTVVNRYHDGTLPEQQWLAHSAGMAYVTKSPGGTWLLEHSIVTPDVRTALNESFNEELEQKDRFLGLSKVAAAKRENAD